MNRFRSLKAETVDVSRRQSLFDSFVTYYPKTPQSQYQFESNHDGKMPRYTPIFPIYVVTFGGNILPTLTQKSLLNIVG